MLREPSQFVVRCPLIASVSYLVTTFGFPKFGLLTGPQSPLAARFVRSQVGVKLPSVMERVTLVTVADSGFAARVNAMISGPKTYWPMLPFTAVLPFPKRSYTAPIRGVTFFQSGTSFTAG